MDNSSEAKKELVTHVIANALRTDGPFQLSSGGTSSWYLDGRQVTYSGTGGRLVAACIGELLDPAVTAVGGLTMGADPVAIATALLADPPLRAFSIRKEAKEHGMGGRLVGPVGLGDRALVVEDTTTTGATLASAIEVLRAAGIAVAQVVTVVDRSDGAASVAMRDLGLDLTSLVTPGDLDEVLGVAEKWEVEASAIGTVTEGGSLVVQHAGELVAEAS